MATLAWPTPTRPFERSRVSQAPSSPRPPPPRPVIDNAQRTVTQDAGGLDKQLSPGTQRAQGATLLASFEASSSADPNTRETLESLQSSIAEAQHATRRARAPRVAAVYF